MKNEMMAFDGNSVEVFELEGQVLFNPYDVGKCLDLTDSAVRMAIAKMNENQTFIVKNSDVKDIDIRKLNNRGENFLTESGVYKLVFKSNKPNAEKFTDWVTDVVLPSIRKTGSYSSTPKKEKLSSVNNAARTILPVLAKAGMKAQYQVLLLKQLYQKADVQIPETRLKADEKLYDKTEIAKILGVFSNNGIPHALAIGAVISKIDVSEDEQELTSFERNGHIGVGYQYTESVIEKIKKWLGENGYPKKIPTANKSFAVKYSEVL